MSHIVSEVHREHLPAGRYNAGPGAHDSVIDPRARDGHAASGHGAHQLSIHIHHASKAYRSVSNGLYGAELYSAACCAAFGLLAVIQLAMAAQMLLVHAPALARSSGSAASSAWVRGRARWLAALVPGTVARCCALLLLIADLSAKAGGEGPGDVSFLFEASSFFDAMASWLFYTIKIGTLTGWAICLHGPSRQSQRLLTVGVLASLVLGLALLVTVSQSLSYGSLCIETHDIGMCQQRETWYATFHIMMVTISLGSFIYFFAVLLGAWRQRGTRTDEPLPPWLVNAISSAAGGEKEDRTSESAAAAISRNNRQRQAAALMPAAHVCGASICWWSIFNSWGAIRAARLIQATPQTVEMAVSVNWVLSEFLPGLTVALVLFFQVRREIARIPGADYTSAATSDAHQLGVYRQDSELGPLRPSTTPRL